MKFWASELFKICCVATFLFAFPQPGLAFLSWQESGNSLEMRGLLRGYGIALNNPDNHTYYNKRSVSALAVSGRAMLDAGFGENLSFEVHAVHSYIPLDLQTGGSNFALLRDIERSDLLDWGYSSGRSHLLIDRLNFQYVSNSLNLKVGRQPLNLAATYYFTPNDFFAPFSAQAFYRTYKPGVDALRADIQLGELSQLSLISVLGYRADSFSDNGWSNQSSSERNSYLTRISMVSGDFEFALLGGSVKKDVVIGGDFQGELFEWLGVRGEGHVNFPDQAGLKRRIELALGFEHRWENSFTFRVEQFYHGSGAANSATYSIASQSHDLYMARNYSAAGLSFEFTPLLTGEMTVIYNWMDESSLLAVYALYSLGDESEFAISATVAGGSRATGTRINSEFGLYASSISCELRSYF